MAPTLLALALLLPASIASAQSAPLADRVSVSLDAVWQSGGAAFTDAFDLPSNQESEHIAISYPRADGLVISGGGAFRIWRHLSAGVDVSHLRHDGTAQVTAKVPHPFFFETPRTVEGTTAVTREEAGVHVTLRWTVALAPRLRLTLGGGPSFITLRQTLVSNVTVTETYPFDTAAFKDATTIQPSKRVAGANGSADVAWFFSRHVGAGALVRYTYARARESTAFTTIDLTAGGPQAGGGLRLVF